MYLKLIGSVFLVLSSTVIGFIKAEELKIRVKKLQELKQMMSFLQGELRFHRAELSEAFASVSEKTEEPFQKFLKKISVELEDNQTESFEVLWENSVSLLILEEGFLKKDQELLRILGNGLGYLDLSMQTELLNQAIFRAEDEIREAKKQQENRERLYQTMGITAGIFLTLLIV